MGGTGHGGSGGRLAGRGVDAFGFEAAHLGLKGHALVAGGLDTFAPLAGFFGVGLDVPVHAIDLSLESLLGDGLALHGGYLRVGRG